MELPEVGKQCAQHNCQQLDFLPLICKCGKIFCSEHFNLHVQTCETSIDLKVEPHKFENIYKCAQSDCKETSLVPIICTRCNRNFCIKHRHLTQCFEKDAKTLAEEKEKIAAPIKQFTEAKIAIDKQIENNITKAKNKGKIKLANKVQLMKIKNKATGLKTIPTSDRIYFNVSYPNGVESRPIFVAKTWSLGRAIDAIADECKIKNENNKSTGKKLRLFKKENNEIVSTSMAEILEKLVCNELIIDGESLVLDYVEEN